MIQFRSIKEYPHRNKISPYIKICGPSVIFYEFFYFFLFFGPNPFWNKTFGIKILQSDVTLPIKNYYCFLVVTHFFNDFCQMWYCIRVWTDDCQGDRIIRLQKGRGRSIIRGGEGEEGENDLWFCDAHIEHNATRTDLFTCTQTNPHTHTHTRTHTHTHTLTHTNTHTHTHMHTQTQTDTNLYAHVYKHSVHQIIHPNMSWSARTTTPPPPTHTHSQTCKHKHTYIHTRARTRVHTHTQKHAHTNIHTYTHKCAHAHILLYSLMHIHTCTYKRTDTSRYKHVHLRVQTLISSVNSQIHKPTTH